MDDIQYSIYIDKGLKSDIEDVLQSYRKQLLDDFFEGLYTNRKIEDQVIRTEDKEAIEQYYINELGKYYPDSVIQELLLPGGYLWTRVQTILRDTGVMMDKDNQSIQSRGEFYTYELVSLEYKDDETGDNKIIDNIPVSKSLKGGDNNKRYWSTLLNIKKGG